MGRMSETIQLAGAPSFRLGPLVVEPAGLRVRAVDAREEAVEPRVMQVLVVLANAAGAVVSREELIRRCWDGRIVGDDAINRVIGRLRRMAEGLAGGAFSIETVTKVGYRLVGAEPAGAEPAVAAEAERVTDRIKWRVPYLLVALLLVLLVSGVAMWWHGQPAADPPLSVAMTGFVALDGVSPAIARAMGEELRTALQESAVEIDDRTAELSVAAAVRRVGRDLRVTTRLDDRLRGRTLWSEVQEVPQDNARALTGAMAALGDTLRCGLDATRSRSPRLSDAQIALYFSFCDNGSAGEGAQKSLMALRALTRDAPDFAPAWFGIAAVAGGQLMRREDPAMRAEGLAAARRGIALAPDKGDGYAYQAVVLSPSQPIERERLLRHALPLDTINCRCAGDFLGDFLLQAGRFRESLAVYRGAEADKVGGPTGGALTLWRLSMACELTGERSCADAYFAKLEDNFGPIPKLQRQRALWREDWPGLALPSAGSVPDHLPASVWQQTVSALATRDAGVRLSAAASLRAIPPEAQVREIPGLLVLLGDREGALTTLEMSRRANGLFAAPGRYPGFAQPLLWDPTLRPLWRDPRFAAFLQRAGFIDYWRRTRSRPDLCAEASSPAFCQTL
jgi:DNA-binding winged helix-turn-helix (wHTH) protein